MGDHGLTPERIAVHRWIRDDCSLVIKMTITPAMIDALLARLASLPHDEGKSR